MPDPLLAGKTAIVVGIANERSYAFHIARALLEQGCRCAFTHLPGEKNERRTRRSLEELPIPGGAGAAWLTPMDASSDEQIEQAFAAYAKA
ncbi:MAG TPA: SDR family oxidoreductase, partial [Phycisphaerales bacterium]|nr:SDR family oxidoreductase [Phycisphaerales bacterium]